MEVNAKWFYVLLYSIALRTLCFDPTYNAVSIDTQDIQNILF